MADFRITCTSKESGSGISHVGGAWGRITVDDAIARMKDKTNPDTFFTYDEETKKRAEVKPLHLRRNYDFVEEALRTDADRSIENNLENLPSCATEEMNEKLSKL